MRNESITTFKFEPFSKKQLKVLSWWTEHSPYKDSNAIIADGSARSGKTISMSLSYIIWANTTYNGYNFGLCGKTIGSLRRNVIGPLKQMLLGLGYTVQDKRADNLLVISGNNHTNYFYLFGGKDESSQDLIQGITLAGCFFDEVVLMPESFVNQATVRCSVTGAKLWFNCNPEGPFHWFKLNWVDKAKEKSVLYLHFTMKDNLSLSDSTRKRYESMYSGVFYQRYILGLWVQAQGVIYDMFDSNKHKVLTEDREYIKYYVSCDYGTQNATVFLLWGYTGGKWYIVDEYYYSGRDKSKQKTDEEYHEDLVSFVNGRRIQKVIIDPSASSFIACIKKHRVFKVLKADNDVLPGIKQVANCLNNELFYINDCCTNTLTEMHSYTWDEKAVNRGEDKPSKVNDHAMDAMRYFVKTVLTKKQFVINM